MKNKKSVWNETDSQAQSGTWYSVEGSCQKLRNIMEDNKFMGGILADQFYDNPAKLSATIEMNLKASDGLMVSPTLYISSTKDYGKKLKKRNESRRSLK
ncbi:hypothetical protein NXW86_29820 [Bacteroides thetaiotaomicron]|uniref:alpha amylase family protein n=1 Tax=Bacteroides thetaiotaomicron TaxID=818 RepID=UPI002166766D|nr:alpha amylase family protein [Bacteroides thetaiotaomicron]MCS2453163.1 hypothetical protein [Bacteroides thetaiotaomicron]